MRCLACYENIPEGTEKCPCCDFVQYQVIGDTDEALNALKMMAARHRTIFLRRFDLGVTAYTWKDRNGLVAPDTKKRISFGTADQLLNGPVWLDQQFARLPETEITVELSVGKAGAPVRTIPVRIAVPQEKQLQQLGVALQEDMKICLLLKNEKSQATSLPVAVFAGA